MVLQLVLPGFERNSVNENHYFDASSLDDILGYSPQKKDSSRTYARESFHSEDLLVSGNGVYINHGFNSDQPQLGQSFSCKGNNAHESTDIYTDAPRKAFESIEQEEKIGIFWNRLTKLLSGIYALFIITLGLAVYVTDVIDGAGPIAETYSLYLVIVSLLYVIFLIVDIPFHNKKDDDIVNYHHKSTNFYIDINDSSLNNPEILNTSKHYYCLSKDQHAANFYLKIGAGVFCFGHLIHSLLLVGYQIMYLKSDSDTFSECATLQTLFLDLLYPIYSFLLLYFIFKYSNIIINKHVHIARFGIMHCIASSICFWVWTIFRETIQALSNHSHNHDEKLLSNDMSNMNFVSDIPIASGLTSYDKRGAQVLTKYLNSTFRLFTELCDLDKGMRKIYQNYSPYLYPFSVEYSILVVGVLYIIWQNIDQCDQHNKCKNNTNKIESNIVVYADFHSANKGLFCGLAVMLLTIVGIILFMITLSSTNNFELATKIHLWNVMSLVTLMLICSILAYRQLTKLDINVNYKNILDDIFLIICIPAFFLNGIFTIIPAFYDGNSMSVIFSIVEVLQVLIQSPLIIDGLRRCSKSRSLRKQKPGRELITFLIVCNVASWISQTFEVESHGILDHRDQFYGEELWTILEHMCIPLMMFYRFHSSVCLVDIWKYAYEEPHCID